MEVKMALTQCINIYKDMDASKETYGRRIPLGYDVFIILNEPNATISQFGETADRVYGIVRDYFDNGDKDTMLEKLNDLFPYGVEVIIK